VWSLAGIQAAFYAYAAAAVLAAIAAWVLVKNRKPERATL
jgi:ABC-type sulfate transport system permease component